MAPVWHPRLALTHLAWGEGVLCLADSETSAVRAVTLGDGTVRALVGKGLFELGNTDGSAAVARLQHPLGLAFDGARHTVGGCRSEGTVMTVSMRLPLAEPGGLAVNGDILWIANTNAHRVDSVAIDIGAEWVLDLRR